MKLLWNLQMAYWIKWSGYEKTWAGAYQFAKDECWQQYRLDGYSPKDAMLEDLGHGL